MQLFHCHPTESILRSRAEGAKADAKIKTSAGSAWICTSNPSKDISMVSGLAKVIAASPAAGSCSASERLANQSDSLGQFQGAVASTGSSGVNCELLICPAATDHAWFAVRTGIRPLYQEKNSRKNHFTRWVASHTPASIASRLVFFPRDPTNDATLLITFMPVELLGNLFQGSHTFDSAYASWVLDWS